jgi:hypothetical protein
MKILLSRNFQYPAERLENEPPALIGEEIGKILGVSYASGSQDRRRLVGRLKKDRKLKELVNKIEVLCQ